VNTPFGKFKLTTTFEISQSKIRVIRINGAGIHQPFFCRINLLIYKIEKIRSYSQKMEVIDVRNCQIFNVLNRETVSINLS
jgi:hypothetical protein